MSKVLVADDDPALLRLVEFTLRAVGHEVITTPQPEAVMGLVQECGVDAVVLDVMMPGRSGFDVLAELRANPRTAALPVLMLSALSDGPHRVRGLREGADDYVTKPLEPQELVLRLERLLAHAQDGAADLQGRLGLVSLGEVAQILLQGGSTGILEVEGPEGRGQITIDGGQSTAASFGRLEGRNAALAMLGLGQGRFRYVRSRRAAAARQADASATIPVQRLLFTGAWLDDELSRRRPLADYELLWPVTADQGPPPTPEGFESLPLFSVWKEILRAQGLSVAELVAKVPYEPRLVRLAVSVLVEHGAVRAARAVRGPGPDGEGSAGAAEPALVDAASAVVELAASRSPAGGQVHALVVVGPAAHLTLLQLRQAVPATALAAPGDSVAGAWATGRAATLPLKGRSGELVLHLVSLEAEAACSRLRGRLGVFAGVVVWAGSPEEVPRMRWVIEEVEAAASGGGGAVVIAEGAETAAVAAGLMAGSSRWRLCREAPPTIARLLWLMAAAAKAAG